MAFPLSGLYLSMREVVQAAQKKRNEGKDKTALRSFLSRCHWNAHFVQKLESEDRMEFEDINRGFTKIERPERPELVEAWKKYMGFRWWMPVCDA